MTRTSALLRTLGVGGLVIATACQDAAKPFGPDVPQIDSTLQAPMEDVREHPDVATLVATVPGFGGLYLDGGVPTVYLTDVGQRARVEPVLRAYGKVRVLQGEYTYKDLNSWFHRLSPHALALAGVVFVDNDEARNRVVVGVEDMTGAAAVRGVAAGLGLPGKAVVVELAKPVRFATTLLDEVRPVMGALQITTLSGTSNYVFAGFCTLGFNVLPPNGELSFITNSHCTSVQGGTEGTLFAQGPANPVSGFRPIGIEVDDPTYFRRVTCTSGLFGGGCTTSSKRYRYSDAARVRYARLLSTGLPAVATDFSIARTPSTTCSAPPCLDVIGSTPIRWEGAAVVGETVSKIGRTTGYTKGNVTKTCADTPVRYTDIVLLCQNSVSAGVKPGDSGSPVFRVHTFWDGTRWSQGAELLGILWGGESNEFWYSPMANIERELGALQTY